MSSQFERSIEGVLVFGTGGRVFGDVVEVACASDRLFPASAGRDA